MTKLIKFFFIFLFFFSFTNAGYCDLTLKELLRDGETGSFLVVEQNKIFTFLHVHEKSRDAIVLEEVVVPEAQLRSKHVDWKKWFEEGAPGHTAWSVSEIDFQSGNLIRTYSFSHQSWVEVEQADHFLKTLLNLRFKEISIDQRRKVGIPPGYNKVDKRPLWNPRLVMNGSIIPDITFSAFKARWPSDGSELSHKTIEIYLPNPISLYSFPTYFPYWLEVEGKFGCAKLRVIDSGMQATSPKPNLLSSKR